MGLSNNEIRDRIGTVGKQVSDVTKRMVECDTINRDKMVSRCKDQRQQIVKKIKELGLEMKMEQISSNLPLAEQNKLLQDQLNEIEQRESEMMAKYR